MALIGSIIGDIIGSQYEFPSWRPDDLDYENCELLTERCEFTDDTVMSIATKYAIDNYKCDFARAYKEFGKMYPDVGYGDMFFKWINDEVDDYKSYGNGSAMRVSYIADVVQDAESIIKLSNYSAKCTHGSDSGMLGAGMVACVIAMAHCGHSKDEIKQFVIDHSSYDISLPVKYLRLKYVWSETCDGTVPAAIRCFLDSTDYESCMRNCLSLPCDMDTMCCIAGGMAEAFYGTTGLDNKAILKKYLTPHLYECIKDIVE